MTYSNLKYFQNFYRLDKLDYWIFLELLSLILYFYLFEGISALPKTAIEAVKLVKTAKEYIDNGVEVDAILGIAGSPSCGVDVTYRFGLQSGSGAFIEELKTAMEEQGIRVPIVEINDALPEKNQAILERISLKEVT